MSKVEVELGDLRDEIEGWFETVIENQNIILENQAEIIEKLNNLSRDGGDYSIEV